MLASQFIVLLNNLWKLATALSGFFGRMINELRGMAEKVDGGTLEVALLPPTPMRGLTEEFGKGFLIHF